MQIIEVHTKSRPSEVYCGAGALEEACRFLKGEDVFVVTDENVAQIYADRIGEWFPKAVVCTVKAGERRKNRGTLFQIIDKMLEAQLHRNSVVAALGGGVIGDMAGFAASVYMRGTRIVAAGCFLPLTEENSISFLRAEPRRCAPSIRKSEHRRVHIRLNTNWHDFPVRTRFRLSNPLPQKNP